MKKKNFFFIFILLLITKTYCSIKFIPINDDLKYCYNIFNKNFSFNKYIISYFSQQDKYILRKIVNKKNEQNYNLKEDKYKDSIDLIHPNELDNFIILKDKSIIILDKKFKKSKYYLGLYYFKYPQKTNPDYSYENKPIELNLNDDIFIIDCSNMIFIFTFGKNNNGIFLYILDEKLQKLYLKEKIDDNNISSLMAINLDENISKILICLAYNIVECYITKYDKKLINGNKLTLFEDILKDKSYINYCTMTIFEKNKVAIAYNIGFEIYYSIIIFDDISLKLGNYKNTKIQNGYKSILNICNHIMNYNENNNLYMNLENNYNNNGKIINSFLNGSCNSFILDECKPQEKIKIDFTNKISEGIKLNKEKIYITYIDKKIELYKNNKKIYINNEFYISDNIYAIIDYSDKPLFIKYNYGNEECQIQFSVKKNYIFIEGKRYICNINKDIKQINNIIYNELNYKILDIYSKEFNFSITYEKEVKNNEIFFYLLNEKINCQKDKNNSHKIICKGSLPNLPLNTYYIDYDIYSTLSCLNKIKIGSIKLRDKYLKQIYDISDLDKITQTLNDDYDPTEKIQNFSVDMISYYYWFSGFSYCEDKSVENNKCCQEELLDDWEILSHKEYQISIFERILKGFLAYQIGNFLDKIKAFLESLSVYIYNFIILKSKKYKKYIFGFPGTTGTKQLLLECLGYSFQKFDPNEPDILVEKFFYETFKLIYKDLFSEEIINELKLNKDYQVIFTGHSLGGAIATLSSYYYAKNKLAQNEPVLITFGQPRVGNENFAKDYMKLIPLVFRVARKGDIVTIIPPARKLKDQKYFNIFNILEEFGKDISKEFKNFLKDFSKSNLTTKIGKFFELIFNLFLNIIQLHISLLIGLLVKLPIFPYGYCHTGGLYLLIDKKFYQCEDFYNEQTGHPICDNWEYETIYDFKNIFDNHSYLRLGENLIGKCQKDKKFWIFS